MNWYILISFTLIVFQVVSNACTQFGVKTSKLNLQVSSLFLLFFMALRNQMVGVDTKFYCAVFQQFQSIPLKRVFTQAVSLEIGSSWEFKVEPGYRLYNKVLSLVFHNNQAVTIVNAVIIAVLVYLLISKYSVSPWLSIWLYLTLGFYQTNMNITRNAIATLLCCNAVPFIFKREWKKYLAVVLFAMTIHISTAVFIPLYWVLRRFHINTRRIVIFVVSFFVLGISYPYISRLFIFRLPGRYGKYLASSNIRAFSVLVGVWIALLYLMLYCLMKKAEWQAFLEKNQAGVWLFLLSMCCYGLTLGIKNGERLAMLFAPYAIISLPSCLIEIQNKKKRNYIGIGLVVLCGVQYFLRLSVNNIGGTVPYIFFWQ